MIASGPLILAARESRKSVGFRAAVSLKMEAAVRQRSRSA
jgi:hypothetical protein